MKSMKGLSMNKMLGSIKKKAGGASLPLALPPSSRRGRARAACPFMDGETD